MYDVVIIGGGHNGLIAASYLAKNGFKVVVFEKNNWLGGGCVTEEVYPRFKYNTLAYAGGLTRPEIIDELGLKKFGYNAVPYNPQYTLPFPDKKLFSLWIEEKKTYNEIEKFSKKDVESYKKFEEFWSKVMDVIEPMILAIPPRFADMAMFIDTPESEEMIRKLFFYSVADLLNEYFESEYVKAALASESIIGVFAGPYTPGTSYMMGHWYLGTINGVEGAWGHIMGGISTLIHVLKLSAEKYGVDTHLNSRVDKIIVDDGKAKGVELKNGQKIYSKIVLSTIDPKTTILNLVGKDVIDSIDKEYRRKIESIKMEGVEFKINIALKSLPKFYAFKDKKPYYGTIAISPSLEYLEKAYDDAKYGGFSKEPYIELVFPSIFDDSFSPPGKHVVSIYCQYTPFSLKNHIWDDDLKEEFYSIVMNVLSEYSPDFEHKIIHKYLVSPLDMEVKYGIAHGHVGQGETLPSQILFFRPVTGFSDYTTPIKNLYLGGAGTHPGAGLFGAAGRNVAFKILESFSINI